MSIINPKYFSEESRTELNKRFREAKPYPHLVLDNFIDEELAHSLEKNFPSLSEMRKAFDGYNENKSEDSSFDKLHPDFAVYKNILHSNDFLSWLETITGIEGLQIPDDHRGAGLHQGKNGSFLDIHVDFSVHPTLKKHRRLNVILFLNKNWNDSYGGLLELWNHDVTDCGQLVSPQFNRCVIFECSEISFHGYDKITCPEGVTRKSFYAYFYTEVTENVRYHDTIFKARPKEGVQKKIVTEVKETTKNMIKRAFYTLGLKSFFEKTE